MATQYVAETVSNLRAQWDGTPPCADRATLVEAIRLATESDRDQPSSQDVEAIANALEAEFVGIDPDAQCHEHGCARHRCDADHEVSS